MFMLVEEPNRYELPAFYALHAWVWQDNPDGVFANFNPDVSCEAVPDTAMPSAPVAGVPVALLGALALAAATAWAARGRRTRRRG
jgi:hypothetical protein